MAPRINIPPLTRGFLAALIALTTLTAALRYRAWASTHDKPFWSNEYESPFLVLLCDKAITHPWTFLSTTFVETNIFGISVTGLSLFYGGRYLERAWSSAEFAKFMLFVTVIPNLLSFVLYYTWFTITGSWHTGDEATMINGGIAIQAGYLVALKQLVPEHTVAIAKGIIRMRVKHFPAIFLLANTLSGVIFGTETAMFLAWFGFMTSWTYLRFYRVSPAFYSTSTGEGATVRGDASDTFAFAHFFPEPIHTPIASLSDAVYNTLVALRLCTPFSDEDIESSNEQANARAEGGGLPSAGRSGRREEAERRRALALKALDQRLQAQANRPQAASTTAPSMLGETNLEPDHNDAK